MHTSFNQTRTVANQDRAPRSDTLSSEKQNKQKVSIFVAQAEHTKEEREKQLYSTEKNLDVLHSLLRVY